MTRSLYGVAAMLALCAAIPALAADYPDLRPAYPESWQNPDDSIRFEFGTAYWYSWGGKDAGFTAATGGLTLGDVAISARDTTHIGELHGKIEDLSTQTYVAARAGLGLHTSGTYSISPISSGAIGNRSAIGYGGADFGWLPAGNMDHGFAFGGLVGYQYWKEAPDIGSGQIGTFFAPGMPPTGMLEARDNLDIHALRLGVKAQANFDMFDIQAEVAAVPYAHVSGVVGGSGPDGFVFPGAGPFYETEQTSLTGRGYGVMAETMVGFRPTENLSLRFGGRAWYIEGKLDAKVKSNFAGLGAAPELNLPSNYASIFRYGVMAELTGRF